jgi:hypothetical protein
MARPQNADEGKVSYMEGSYENIDKAVVAGSRHMVVLKLGGWVRCQQLLNIKSYLVMKCSHTKPQNYNDNLV